MQQSKRSYGGADRVCEPIRKLRLRSHNICLAKVVSRVAQTINIARIPLLHFVLDDLPTSTKAPDLDDTNTRALLRAHTPNLNMTVSDTLMGKYLAWLVGAGFLPSPSLPNPQKALPSLGGGVIKAAGRSGL